jgi:hypothetical protein
MIFILGFLANQTLSSQELEFQIKNLSPRMTEEFCVLKSNKKIKEGMYKLLINNSTCQLGHYKNNLRSGIWSIFCCGNGLDSPEIIYNYDTNQILFETVNPYRLDTTLIIPIYLGGIQYFQESIIDLIDPNETKFGNGNLHITFNVDSIGVPNNFKLKSSCNNRTLDFMALDAVKKVATSNFKFIAARRHGKPISYVEEVSIVYTYKDIKVRTYD